MQYNNFNLIHLLNWVDWMIQSDTVQGCLNYIENKLIKIVDNIPKLQELKKTLALSENQPLQK
jgi:hypothetical protein